MGKKGGEVFFYIVHHAGLTGTLESRVDTLWAAVQKHYHRSQAECRLGSLSASMFQGTRNVHGEFPQLSCSGAEGRDLIPVCLGLIEDFRVPGDLLFAHMELCARSLIKLRALLVEGGFRPSLPQSQQFVSETQAFAMHYSYLHTTLVRERGILAFNIIPKGHAMLHASVAYKFLNQRWVWTYGWESWLSRIARVVRSAKAGIPLLRCGQHVMAKYSQLLVLRLRQWTPE